MKSLSVKIIKVLIHIVALFTPKYCSIAKYKFLLSFYTKFGNNKKTIYDKLNKKYCESYFKIFSGLKTDLYHNDINTSIPVLENTIFVYWSKGFDSMPKLVKICYKNLLKTTRFKVLLLDSSNICKYSTIPEEIFLLLSKGKIEYTLFSEILRTNLLSIHKNCIWLDATCFLYKDFPDDIFSYKFLTVYPGENKSLFDNIPKFFYAPDLKFQQSYFLTGSDNKIFLKMYNLLINYLLQENMFRRSLRPYYLLYYTFEFLYQTDEQVYEAAIKRVINNDFAERIEGNLNSIYRDKDEIIYFNDETYLYKLSYKVKFQEYSKGELTNFGFLLHSKGIYNYD